MIFSRVRVNFSFGNSIICGRGILQMLQMLWQMTTLINTSHVSCVSGEFLPLSMEKMCNKKKKKVIFSMVYKATLKKLNSLNIDNVTNCFGVEITFNSNKKYKYLPKIIFL